MNNYEESTKMKNKRDRERQIDREGERETDR